jgi:aminoglycoside phosphotransferase (APT) family kinase protein
LWGDVRFGNVVFDAASCAPKAVLDWDMTGVGPIEHDVGWYLALEAVQTDLTGAHVAGFGDRDETIAIVSGAVGRPLLDLEWYETFALVRASAIQTRITILFERAGRRPMFAVGEDPTLAAVTARITA